jgi:ATP-dependent Clp endopeptidase proteolytic subunit ClpP
MTEPPLPAPPPNPETVKLEQEKLRAEIDKIHTDEEAVKVDIESKRKALAGTEAGTEKTLAEARTAKAAATVAEIQARGMEVQEKQEYAKNKYHHVYVFDRQVTSESVKACIQQLTEWMREPSEEGAKKAAIEIIITSPGGVMVDGLALFDYIQQVRAAGHHVTTSALGMAASMAGVLLQAGDKRVMSREAWLLIHEGSFGAIGSAGEVEDTVEWVRRLRDRMMEILASRAKVSKATIARRARRKDWWLSSKDAIGLGLIDAVR